MFPAMSRPHKLIYIYIYSLHYGIKYALLCHPPAHDFPLTLRNFACHLNE